MHILRDNIACSLLEELIHNCLSNRGLSENMNSNGNAPLRPHSLKDDSGDTLNPFVDYLNSLQRTSAGNENAIAESQACNPQFGCIHVPHRLSGTIISASDGQEWQTRDSDWARRRRQINYCYRSLQTLQEQTAKPTSAHSVATTGKDRWARDLDNQGP